MVAAVLWAVAVIPAAMGFWLVAGSVAGVGPGQVGTLVTASLLALGIATVLQVAFGFRLPMYEGPASAYLAATRSLAPRGTTASHRSPVVCWPRVGLWPCSGSWEPTD